MGDLNIFELILVILASGIASYAVVESLRNFGFFKTKSIHRIVDIKESKRLNSELDLIKINLELKLLYTCYYNFQIEKNYKKKITKDFNNYCLQFLENSVYDEIKRKRKITTLLSDLDEFENVRLKITDDSLTNHQLKLLNYVISDTPKITLANSLSIYIRKYLDNNEEALIKLSQNISNELRMLEE
jgi:hypothetical protein